MGFKRKRSSDQKRESVVAEEPSRLGRNLKELAAFPEALDEDTHSGLDLGSADEELTVNEDYAKRFEHNKKRAEKHRCKFITRYYHCKYMPNKGV